MPGHGGAGGRTGGSWSSIGPGGGGTTTGRREGFFGVEGRTGGSPSSPSAAGVPGQRPIRRRAVGRSSPGAVDGRARTPWPLADRSRSRPPALAGRIGQRPGGRDLRRPGRQLSERLGHVRQVFKQRVIRVRGHRPGRVVRERGGVALRPGRVPGDRPGRRRRIHRRAGGPRRRGGGGSGDSGSASGGCPSGPAPRPSSASAPSSVPRPSPAPTAGPQPVPRPRWPRPARTRHQSRRSRR